MIYNRVRRKPLLRDYLSGGFLLWMQFVKHRDLLRVEHTAESDVDVAMLVHGALDRDTEDKSRSTDCKEPKRYIAIQKHL